MNRIRKYFITLLLLLATVPVRAEEPADESLTIMLTGASFAVRANGWFELGCEQLGATPLNKAVSAQAIMNTANDMYNEKFYTFEQLDETDIFVIDHVHNQNVANEEWLKENYEDYTMPTTNYAIAYDYVIKRYTDECRRLKDNPDSKYYGSENGKPAVIVLCTHWHDSRTVYNAAIRKLAEKWNLPLIEFDKLIGFSKDQLIDGKQPSLLYAGDTETIDGVTYGWHPKRGQGEYIQQKMAQIFVKKISEVLGKPLEFKAEFTAKDFAVLQGEQPIYRLSATGGLYPYSFSYDIDGTPAEPISLTENPYFLKLDAEHVGKPVNAISLTDGEGNDANLTGSITVDLAQRRILPTYDSYVQESSQNKSYSSEPTLLLKNGENWSRKIYLTFPTAGISADDSRIVLRIFLQKTDKNIVESLLLEGNTRTYNESLTWANKDRYPFSAIGESSLAAAEAGSYLSWDVTGWIKQKKEEGAENVTFRVSVKSEGASLSTFPSIESEELPEQCPNLIVVENSASGVNAPEKGSPEIFPTRFSDVLNNPAGLHTEIYSAEGRLMFSGNSRTIGTSGWGSGIYLAKSGNAISKLIKH